MTSRQIAERALEIRGVTDCTDKFRQDFTAGIHKTLRSYDGRVVKQINPRIIPARWALT